MNTPRPRISSSSRFLNSSPSLTSPPSLCILSPSKLHFFQESEHAIMRETIVKTRSGAVLEVVLRSPGMVKCSLSAMVEMAELWRDGSRKRREEEEREAQGYATADHSSSLSCSSSNIPINNKGKSSKWWRQHHRLVVGVWQRCDGCTSLTKDR